MDNWQIFSCIGIILIALEAFVPGFILLPCGVAALIAAFSSIWITSLEWQLVVLGLSMIAITMFFHLYVKPRMKKTTALTNADSMIGKTAVVTKEINNEALQGQVKLYGDTWRALNIDDTSISIGTTVTIVSLDGNKVVVKSL